MVEEASGGRVSFLATCPEPNSGLGSEELWVSPSGESGQMVPCLLKRAPRGRGRGGSAQPGAALEASIRAKKKICALARQKWGDGVAQELAGMQSATEGVSASCRWPGSQRWCRSLGPSTVDSRKCLLDFIFW